MEIVDRTAAALARGLVLFLQNCPGVMGGASEEEQKAGLQLLNKVRLQVERFYERGTILVKGNEV